MLNAGATPGTQTSNPAEDQRALALIKQTFYNAWQQPSSQTRPAEVRITFDRNGNVTGRSLAVSSGNTEMDNSVMSAARAVTRIPNLPSGFTTRNPTVTVVFDWDSH